MMSYQPYAHPDGSYADNANPRRPEWQGYGPTVPISVGYDVTHIYYRKEQDSPEVELVIPFRFGMRTLADGSSAYFSRYKTGVETGIERAMLEGSIYLLGTTPAGRAIAPMLKKILPLLEPATEFPDGSRYQTLRTMLGLFLGNSSLSPPYANPWIMPSDVMLSLSEDSFSSETVATAQMAAFFYLVDLKLYEWMVDVDLANLDFIKSLQTSVTNKQPLLEGLLQACMQMSVGFGQSAKPDYVGLRVTQLTKRADIERAKRNYPQLPTRTSW